MSTGSIYLLHFDPGLPIAHGRIARHYIGWTASDIDGRVALHLRGTGSPLVRAVLRAGGQVTVERTWANVDRTFERRLKNRKEAPRLCPRCVREGRTAGRGLLEVASEPEATAA